MVGREHGEAVGVGVLNYKKLLFLLISLYAPVFDFGYGMVAVEIYGVFVLSL